MLHFNRRMLVLVFLRPTRFIFYFNTLHSAKLWLLALQAFAHICHHCTYYNGVSLCDKSSRDLTWQYSEWRNMRDSIVVESILSFKGQFASSKLNINTWATRESGVMIWVSEGFLPCEHWAVLPVLQGSQHLDWDRPHLFWPSQHRLYLPVLSSSPMSSFQVKFYEDSKSRIDHVLAMGTLTEHNAVTVIRSVLGVVDYLHHHGIVH